MVRYYQGYSTLIVTLIAWIMAGSINQQHVATWHLKKLLSIEGIKERILTRQADELAFIIRYLNSYKYLNSIPNSFIVKHNSIALKCNMVVADLNCNLNNLNGAKCKIFKTEMHSSFDFNRFNEYHEIVTSTYLYVLVCQNLNSDASNDHQIKTFPFSKFLTCP